MQGWRGLVVGTGGGDICAEDNEMDSVWRFAEREPLRGRDARHLFAITTVASIKKKHH